MKLDRKYFMLTLAMYFKGQLDFTEPNLVKSFSELLSISTGTKSKLVQSDKKMDGSFLWG